LWARFRKTEQQQRKRIRNITSGDKEQACVSWETRQNGFSKREKTGGLKRTGGDFFKRENPSKRLEQEKKVKILTKK